MDWQFKLFGKPEVWHHQHQLDGFNTQKTQALLFYLIAEGCEQNRNQLACFFWDDFNLISSQNNLRTALYHLKQDFGACLAVDRQSVSFCLPESACLDLALVDAVSPNADLQTLAAAADAYQGDFLEGFTTSIPKFEAWKEAKQAHYRQITINHLLRLAELYEKDQQFQDALDTAQRILEIDPSNESAVLLQMRLGARHGLHEQTVQAYRNYQTWLQEHPATIPSSLIEDFYNNLKLHIPNQVITSLPSSQTRFFGREEETSQLTRWLTDPALRWINLVGHRGIGKSRLAIHTAEALVSQFKDGIHYFDLHGTDAGDDELSIENVSKLILYSLQTKLYFDQTYTSQLHQALIDRDMVLIFDNFDSRDWQGKFTRDLLQSSPSIKLLGISRQPIDIPDQMVIKLEGLAYPPREALPPAYAPDFVSQFPSLQLFEDRAQMVQPGFKIDQGNYQQVTHICRVVQGMPLGIENIAYLLRAISLAEIMGTIQGETAKDPTTPAAATLSKELGPVFDYIWSNLPPKSQEIALATGLFTGSFTKDTFSAVTQEHTDWLMPLVESSLLHMKFSPHYLVQDFFKKHQAHMPEHYPTRFCDYYLNKLIDLDHEAAIARYPVKLVESDQSNLVQAWALALDQGQYALLTRACGPLARMYEQLGSVTAGYSQLQKAVASLEELPNRSDQQELALGTICLACAGLAEKCGSIDAAHTMINTAFSIAQALRDTGLLAGTLRRKASLSIHAGQTRTAAKYAYDGLTQAVKSGDERLVAGGIISLAQAYASDHQYQKAMAAYKTALDKKLVGDDSRDMQALFLGLSRCLTIQGRFNRALATHQKAQHLNEKFTDPVDKARLAFGLGEIEKYQGRLDQALLAYSEALPVFSGYERPGQQTLSLGNLGILRYWQGEYKGALQHLDAAEAIAREKGLHLLPEVLALKARVYLAAGQKETARVTLQEAVQASQAEGDGQKLTPTLASASINLALAEGAYDTAYNLALELLPTMKDLPYGSLDDPFSIYLSLYRALKNRSTPAALEVLAHARQQFSQLSENLTPAAMNGSFLSIPHRRELSQIIQNQIRP